MRKLNCFILLVCTVLGITGCSQNTTIPAEPVKVDIPGILTIQIEPEDQEIEFIRAFDSKLPFIRRDMAPLGRGLYRAKFPEDTDVSVLVNDGNQELEKNIRVTRNTHQYLKFIVGKDPEKVEFIRMKANKELNFRAVNKQNQKKRIYLSYIDYVGQDLNLKSKIEDQLRAMDYKIATTPNDQTELLAIINLTDFTQDEETNDFNNYITIKYKFQVKIEQRIPGKTILEKKFAFNTSVSDAIDYGNESYPMNGVVQPPPFLIVKENPPEAPLEPVVAEAPLSPGLLVMLGVVDEEKEAVEEGNKDEEKKEEPAENEKAKPEVGQKEEKPEAMLAGTPEAMLAGTPDEKKEEEAKKAEETETDGEVDSPTSTIAKDAYMDTKGTLSNALLNYYVHKEISIIEASVRLINLTPRDGKAISEITKLLSKRLARLFNL
jgi:hypothetical protein